MATAPKLRHFVLVEPFRKADVSIFEDTPLGFAQATALFNQFEADSKRVKFVTSTGTVGDLDGTMRSLRRDLSETR